MILGTLKYSSRVESLHPLFKTVFDYVKSHDLLSEPLGKIVLDGDKLFINNVCPKVGTKESQPLELHRKYLDVHVLLEGKETIGWKSIEDVENYTQEYQEEGDCALSNDVSSAFIEMKPGDFMIVYPEDAHAPAISDAPIRKLIVKLLL